MTTLTNDDCLALVEASPEQSCKRLADRRSSGDLRAVAPRPERVSVGEVLGTWGVRAKTTKKAGIEMLGYRSLERSLRSKPPDATVLTTAFNSHDYAFVLFAAERPRELLGCICVPRRAR